MRIRHLASAAVLALALVACSDSTGPSATPEPIRPSYVPAYAKVAAVTPDLTVWTSLEPNATIGVGQIFGYWAEATNAPADAISLTVNEPERASIEQDITGVPSWAIIGRQSGKLRVTIRVNADRGRDPSETFTVIVR